MRELDSLRNTFKVLREPRRDDPRQDLNVHVPLTSLSSWSKMLCLSTGCRERSSDAVCAETQYKSSHTCSK